MFRLLLVTLAVVLPTALHAQSGGKTVDERMAMPLFPSGWTEHPTQGGSAEIVEFVPKGQSPAQWSEKITLEIHRGANALPPDAFQGRALAVFRDSCDGVVERPVQTGLNNGYPSAFWILGCMRDKSGTFGEIRYTKAVQGNGTLYLLSRSWRSKPFPNGVAPITPQQADDAVNFLSTSVVCANSAQHPCPADAGKNR